MDIFCQYLATSKSHVRNPSDCVSKVCLVPWGGGRDQAGQLGDYQCQADGQHWGCQEAVLQLIGADDQQGETFDTIPSLVRPCQYCNTSNKYLYNVLGFGSSFLLACRRPGLLCFVGWALSKPVSLPASTLATRYLVLHPSCSDKSAWDLEPMKEVISAAKKEAEVSRLVFLKSYSFCWGGRLWLLADTKCFVNFDSLDTRLTFRQYIFCKAIVKLDTSEKNQWFIIDVYRIVSTRAPSDSSGGLGGPIVIPPTLTEAPSRGPCCSSS